MFGFSKKEEPTNLRDKFPPARARAAMTSAREELVKQSPYEMSKTAIEMMFSHLGIQYTEKDIKTVWAAVREVIDRQLPK